MKTSVTRRDFFDRSGRLLAGVGAAAMLPAAAGGGEEKPSLCLSCRDVHLKQTAEKDCWSAMRSIEAEGVEAVINEDLSLPGLFHPERRYSATTAADVEVLVADMDAAGRRVSALCMFNRFEERAAVEIELCTKAARAAKALGVKAIRIDLAPRKLAPAEFLEFSVSTLKKVVMATESTGVAFGIENHGKVTNDPEFLKPLLDRVGSNRLGVTLDTGNFYWFGHPLGKLYDLFETFAPHVCHTHCKSIKFPEAEREKRRPMGWEYGKYCCPIYEGDIDFRRVVAILRKAGYAGDLCVEDESLGRFPAQERGAILAKEIAHLKGLL